jgi:hypothetical protein
VPVSSILGSVGRAHELGSDFLPLRKTRGSSRETARYRWVKKAMMQAGDVDVDNLYLVAGRYTAHGDYQARRDTALPPVELYKLGEIYYVLDGHHRVAAAKSLGQMAMEAIVTEYTPAVPAQATESAA